MPQEGLAHFHLHEEKSCLSVMNRFYGHFQDHFGDVPDSAGTLTFDLPTTLRADLGGALSALLGPQVSGAFSSTHQR